MVTLWNVSGLACQNEDISIVDSERLMHGQSPASPEGGLDGSRDGTARRLSGERSNRHLPGEAPDGPAKPKRSSCKKN